MKAVEVSSAPLYSIKVHCQNCDSSEAFNPVWFRDINDFLNDVELKHRHRLPDEAMNRAQRFMLVYQCQRCREALQVFVVVRVANKLYLHGRSPMEHFSVPSFIPKPERHLYRDSVIAFQSGKHLAALFYLRSFIEQFARRITETNGKVTGQSIMEAYGRTFPVFVRDHIPSLAEWYEKLSEPIHAAKDDDKMYEAAVAEIDHHFEIRQVHRLKDESVKVDQAGA